MEGPRCKNVSEVLDVFDFDAYGEQGRVDYMLGADRAAEFMWWVAATTNCSIPISTTTSSWPRKPYYLFFRPYHLCHLETTRAIAKAVLYGGPS